jgi:hypothetical protein
MNPYRQIEAKVVHYEISEANRKAEGRIRERGEEGAHLGFGKVQAIRARTHRGGVRGSSCRLSEATHAWGEGNGRGKIGAASFPASEFAPFPQKAGFKRKSGAEKYGNGFVSGFVSIRFQFNAQGGEGETKCHGLPLSL